MTNLMLLKNLLTAKMTASNFLNKYYVFYNKLNTYHNKKNNKK